MSDPNTGEGWYEWHKMPQNTTHIAYVHENGSVYLPEGDADQSDFLLASARGHVHRLVRAEEADRYRRALEAIAALTSNRADRTDGSNGA